jgi:hypothetical protein
MNRASFFQYSASVRCPISVASTVVFSLRRAADDFAVSVVQDDISQQVVDFQRVLVVAGDESQSAKLVHEGKVPFATM